MYTVAMLNGFKSSVEGARTAISGLSIGQVGSEKYRGPITIYAQPYFKICQNRRCCSFRDGVFNEKIFFLRIFILPSFAGRNRTPILR